MTEHVTAGALEVAYEESGDPDGTPVVLLHGFPYDVHAYEAVAPTLAARGCRVVVPYLRGYGPTRFLSSDTLRSGQQAALAHDLLALMDALSIERAVLAGYDWGGRAACIVSALWPERAIGLVLRLGVEADDRLAHPLSLRREQTKRPADQLSLVGVTCGQQLRPQRAERRLAWPILGAGEADLDPTQLVTRHGETCGVPAEEAPRGQP